VTARLQRYHEVMGATMIYRRASVRGTNALYIHVACNDGNRLCTVCDSLRRYQTISNPLSPHPPRPPGDCEFSYPTVVGGAALSEAVYVRVSVYKRTGARRIFTVPV